MGVDKQEVERLFNGREKIRLIQLYRSQTGAGLKDAKDAIDGVIPFLGPGVDPALPWSGKLPQLLALFFPDAGDSQADDMLKAIMVMKDSWKELGFKSFKAGVLTILDNF